MGGQPRKKAIALGRDETLRDFLARTLPRGDVHFFATAFTHAAARYDRYSANRHQWVDYAGRRNRLLKITHLASALAANLSELDILSRDELTSQVDPKGFEVLIGSINLLAQHVSVLVKDTQSIGAPRDLAEERWIEEVADIYENAFRQPAKANWMAFRRVLQMSCPSSLPRFGKLDLRQVKRALQRRPPKGKRILQIRRDAGTTS
jgi:hypothetical protein